MKHEGTQALKILSCDLLVHISPPPGAFPVSQLFPPHALSVAVHFRLSLTVFAPRFQLTHEGALGSLRQE